MHTSFGAKPPPSRPAQAQRAVARVGPQFVIENDDDVVGVPVLVSREVVLRLDKYGQMVAQLGCYFRPSMLGGQRNLARRIDRDVARRIGDRHDNVRPRFETRG